MQTINDTDDDSVMTIRLRNLNSKKLTMPKLLGIFTFILTASLLLTSGNVSAEVQANPAMPTASPGLENTGRNVRDKNDNTLTPENQKETRRDVRITKAIRKAIVKRESLSVNAHNAKIITRNGVVTLRGPVENTEEKTTLQMISEKIRGVKKVDNQLEVKAP